MRGRLAHMLQVTVVTVVAAILVTSGSGCGFRLPFWRREANRPPATQPPLSAPQPPAAEPPATAVDTSPVVPVDGPPAGAKGGIIDRRYAIPLVTSAPAGWKRVALTFDAGWEFELTPKLLDLLDAAGIKATFFLRGAWVNDHPDLARDIAARGHEIESHSYTHPDMTKLTDDEVQTELDKEDRVFADILALQPAYFRPPYGAWNKHMLELLGDHGSRAAIMWTVDTLDWESPGVDAIVAKAATAKDGSIVLMHLGAAQTIDALPQIIADLRARGLAPVTLKQLLGASLEPAASSGQ